MNALRAVCTIVFVFSFASVTTAQEKSNVEKAEDFYGLGCKRQNKQPKLALRYFSKAIELNPQHADAYFTRSSVHAQFKQYDQAIKDLSSVVKLKPGNYSALFNRGLYHEYVKQWDHAIRDYGLALSEGADYSNFGSPESEAKADAHHYRGRVYHWRKQDYKKALEDYNQAVKLHPPIRMVHYRRGQVNHWLKNYAQANQDFAKAAEEDPDYGNLLVSWGWLLATCPDKKVRDSEKAMHTAERLVRVTRNSNSYLHAAALAAKGKFEKAAEVQKAVIEKSKRRDKKFRDKLQVYLKVYEAGRAVVAEVPME